MGLSAVVRRKAEGFQPVKGRSQETLCGRGHSSHPSWPARACPPEHLEGDGAEEGGGKDKEEGMSAWQGFRGSPARGWCKSFRLPLPHPHPTKNSLSFWTVQGILLVPLT